MALKFPRFALLLNRGAEQIVEIATLVSVALAVHAAVNSRLLRTPPPVRRITERVSLLLPVRDEAHRVEPCLRALLDQQHLDDLEVIVLDDGSSDGTGDVVRRVAGERVRLIDGVPLAPGWLGKPHACMQLADTATGDVLVFVDADTVLRPDAVARSVALLRDLGLHLVSPYPKQAAETVAERLVQPLLQWSWLTFLPLRAAERSRRPSLTAANGQLLVVDAAAYRSVDGHRAVRRDVLDDVALARTFKRNGLRCTVADGTTLATCRMYDGAVALREGYAKSLSAAFGGSATSALAVAALLGWVYVVPPLAALRGSRAGRLGYAAGVAGRAVAARRTGGRVVPDVLAHPLSVVAFCGLVVDSVARRGRVDWKGRPVG
jgi:glycosyltransferase involved in cell wall biosynthesis